MNEDLFQDFNWPYVLVLFQPAVILKRVIVDIVSQRRCEQYAPLVRQTHKPNDMFQFHIIKEIQYFFSIAIKINRELSVILYGIN